jgi:hypothetical protein
MKFDPSRDNLFSMRNEVAHTKLRSKMAAGVGRSTLGPSPLSLLTAPTKYSGKENESMEDAINVQIDKLIRLIETKYLSSSHSYRPIDFNEKASFFTLDVISDLAFGQAFGYLERDEDVYDYLKITKSFIPIMMLISNVPSLADLLQSDLLRGLLPSESDKLGFGAFIGYVSENCLADYLADCLCEALQRGL